MKLKFIKPSTAAKTYKASIHRTGKIGFTIETATNFDIKVGKSMGLAINEDDLNDNSIYGVLYDVIEDDAYKVSKAGDYHSINAKSFFDTIKLDYSKGDLSYNITEIEIDGTKVLKFNLKKTEKNIEKENNKDS